MLAEALEHLVRGIVDHPDDVVVRDKQMRRGSILEVRVHPDDLGKVIGRNGRTATAFRTAAAGGGSSRLRLHSLIDGRHPTGWRPSCCFCLAPAWTLSRWETQRPVPLRWPA